jgi:hypothetical protein
MDNNAQYIYQSLLAETDQEARSEYIQDPRVQMYASRSSGSNPVEVFQRAFSNAEITDEVSNEIQVEPEQVIDSLAVPVQNQPNMIETKRIIIVDTAQRDWTKQPDAYSNVFGFGTQTPSILGGGGSQVPYYYNNQLIPFSAYEMPVYGISLGTSLPPNQFANKYPKIIPGSSVPITAPDGTQGLTVGTPYGWSLVISPAGTLKHLPQPISPTDNVVYFPTYDARQSKGAVIGVDSNIRQIDTDNLGFSTQLKLSNIASLKLARATLPIRKFDTYNPNAFSSGGSNSANLLNTFHAEPYILMNISNLKGEYYGATQVIQNAFTALVQQQRTPLDAGSTGLLSQFQDYYPWSDETFEFDSPLSQLSNITITLANNNGEPFSHLDDLNVVFIGVNNSRAANISSGLAFGTLRFYVSRDRENTVYPSSNLINYFAANEIRAGDEITFYSPTISQITNDPQTSDPMYDFFNILYNQSVLVTKVYDVDLSTTLPMLSACYAFDAVIKTTGFANTVAVYTNLSAVCDEIYATSYPTLSGLIVLQKYTNSDPAISATTLSGTFLGDYPLPMMNVNMQNAYAFEVKTLEPDKSQLKKIIPN